VRQPRRAVAGLLVTLAYPRMLRLRPWSHSYGQPPAHVGQLATELDDLLARVDTLLGIGRQMRAIESKHPAESKRIIGSMRKLDHAATKARHGRHAIGDMIAELSDRPVEVYSLRPPAPTRRSRSFSASTANGCWS
jgi:hypothetical protein